MTSYSPTRTYDQELDVRFTSTSDPDWAGDIVRGTNPSTHCWLVVMPRRSGKTWITNAVRESRLRKGAGPTVLVDLRGSARAARKAGVYSALVEGSEEELALQDGILIIDEPGPAVEVHRAEGFAAGLMRIKEAGGLPVVFLTPGEYEILSQHLEADAEKDTIVPPALRRVEADRMAERVPEWGPALVDEIGRLDPPWLRSPFLLELVLHTAERRPVLRTDIPLLLSTAMNEARSRYRYLDQLLKNGLTEPQRADLRGARWRAAGVTLTDARSAGLVGRTTIPRDPVVEWHLPEVLRIHHISDLHHGGNLRANVDAKDTSPAGRRFAQVAGAGTPLDRYLAHVRQLASQGQAPHIVLVTGDVVNRPDDAFGQAARAWLGDLRDVLPDHPDLGPDDERIVLVGGNHDVSWDQCVDENPHARHEWFAVAFHDYPHADLHLPAATNRRLEVRYPAAGLRLLLLGSAESGGESRLIQELKEAVSEGDETAVLEVVDKLEHLDPGIVSRAVLDRITPESGMLTFAALHHPVSPVPAVEVAPYSGIVNAGQAKRALAEARTALVLHGHTHMSFFAAERILNATPNWTMRIAGAASLAAASSDEQNGYNQVFVAREGGAHTVLVRPMRLDGGQWTAQPSFAFRPGEPDESPLAGLGLDVVPRRVHARA